MSVGIKEIDDDHRRLVSILNDFEAAGLRGAGAVDEGSLRTILVKLRRYTQEHFEREERLQEARHYQGYEENKEQHEWLLYRLDELVERYHAGQLGEGRAATAELSVFLKSWLIDHIIKIDLKMKGKMG